MIDRPIDDEAEGDESVTAGQGALLGTGGEPTLQGHAVLDLGSSRHAVTMDAHGRRGDVEGADLWMRRAPGLRSSPP